MTNFAGYRLWMLGAGTSLVSMGCAVEADVEAGDGSNEHGSAMAALSEECPLAESQGPNAVDMVDYVLPSCGGPSRAWKLRNANGEITGEEFRTIPLGEPGGRARYVMLKDGQGDGYEEWFVDGDHLRVRLDRTWAYCVTPDGSTCAENPGGEQIWCDVQCSENNDFEHCAQRHQHDASKPYYAGDQHAPWAVTLYQDASPAGPDQGAPFIKRKMDLPMGACRSFSTSMRLAAVQRDTGGTCVTNFDNDEEVGRTVEARRHSQWQGFHDVVQLHVVNGPGEGEDYFYARGLGWVGFNSYVADKHLVDSSAVPQPSAASEAFSQSSVCTQAGNNCAYFPETSQHLCGRFREFWEQNGGLPVFGYPLEPQAPEMNLDIDRPVLAQRFERYRFELHPENSRPFDVLLGRLGAELLARQGRGSNSDPEQPQEGCLYFHETQKNVCDQESGVGFRTYWETHGLQDPGMSPYARSLALFGLPLTVPTVETNSSGDTVLTQWFERARFEWHPDKPREFKVLLGLLGKEIGATPAIVRQEVTWTNLVLAGASGSALARDPGWGWSAGASSVEEIAAGDGYAEFSTDEANRSKIAGLSHSDGDQGYGDIDHAIFLRDDGVVEVYEGGLYRGTFGAYAAGDIFRVEVSGGQVRYRQNGQVFHSSATPPTYPLVLDTSLYHGGATIAAAFVESCASGDFNCMPAEPWKNVGFAMSSGGTLTRTPGWGWSAGASSVEEIAAGDGYAEFSTDEANRSKMAGLGHGDGDLGYGDIDYAIVMRDDGVVEVYEGGFYRGTFGSYAAGDVFRVEVSGGQVRYRQNGQVFHSSATPPTYPLVLDTSLYHGGATITNALVESCTSGDITCMPAEPWKNVGFAMSSGGTLKRTPGWGWSAGASSVEQIAAGDGYAEFSTDEANRSKMAGLGHGDGDLGYGDIDHAIVLRDDGVMEVYEGGFYRGTFGSYAAGDVFRVEVSGGQVRYRQNGQVFHSSATPPTYPLVLDTSLYHDGATIKGALVDSCTAGDINCMPAEPWKNVGFAVSSGGTLTRTPGWGWSAGASSVEQIAAGDGYAEFSTDEANRSKMAGLSHGDGDLGYGDIDHAILLRDDGVMEVYEGGFYRGTFGSYAAGDVFRVEVSGGQVRYRQNGQVFHSSATPPTYPLVLDTSLYHGGATITNALVE